VNTQKDVAKLANVSIATVSRYINKVGYISPEVKERIQIAIDQLEYKPNLLARSLKLKKSHIIGLIFPDIDNPFFIELIKNVENAAHSLGYNVILCNTQNNLEEEKIYIEMLTGKMVDGYIIIPSISDSPEVYDALKGEKVVFVDRTCGLDNKPSILLDNRFGVSSAVDYLVSLGHRRIGSVHVPINVTTGLERFNSFLEVCSHHRLDVEEEIIKNADFTIESSYFKTMELLDLGKPPTAIMTMSGLTTIGALKAIREKKLNIPNDISIIGFDEFEYIPLFDPPITTVVQPVSKFGNEAMRILFRLLEKKSVKKKKIFLKPELIIRQSCKKIG
jgi:LacI family transcriptional regulator, galactose operon repressor